MSDSSLHKFLSCCPSSSHYCQCETTITRRPPVRWSGGGSPAALTLGYGQKSSYSGFSVLSLMFSRSRGGPVIVEAQLLCCFSYYFSRHHIVCRRLLYHLLFGFYRGQHLIFFIPRGSMGFNTFVSLLLSWLLPFCSLANSFFHLGLFSVESPYW